MLKFLELIYGEIFNYFCSVSLIQKKREVLQNLFNLHDDCIKKT